MPNLYLRTHHLFFILFFVAFPMLFNAQQEKESEGYAEIKMLPNSTLEQTKQRAIDAAKVDAIEKAFGSVVMEGNTLYTINKQEGTKLEFNQVFNSISDVYVNGDWIKDIEPPKVERVIKGDDIYYTAVVKGLIRELKTNPANFKTKALSCENKTCETEIFNNGQDLFLYFKAPADGYVSVYMDIPNEHTTYRLLPYKSESNVGGTAVKADVEYIFFSSKMAPKEKVAIVDELTLSNSEKGMPETDKLFVLYRQDVPLDKPMLSTTKKTQTKENPETKLEMPLNLPSEEFQKWLQLIRSRNKDIQLSTLYITIKP